MNITIVRLLLGMFLLVVPALILFRSDRRFLRQSAKVILRFIITMSVLAGCLYFIFEWNKAWVNIVWVLLSSGVATAVYCKKRWQSIPIYISMTVVTFVMGLIVLLLADVPHLFSASVYIPVMTMLQAEVLFVCRRGITTYVLERRSHKDLFEYLKANGATEMEALRPFVTKAITRAFTPILQQLLLAGLVFVPSLLCGLLIGGFSTLQAIGFVALMTVAALSSTMLVLVLCIFIYTKIS